MRSYNAELIKTLMFKYGKRCSHSSFVFGGETMDVIICEEQWLVLTKELIKCSADVERTKPNRIWICNWATQKGNLNSWSEACPIIKRQTSNIKMNLSCYMNLPSWPDVTHAREREEKRKGKSKIERPHSAVHAQNTETNDCVAFWDREIPEMNTLV